MPNSLQSSDIASPASRRATNCSLSSITEHSFQGIITPSPEGESVTYVSGTMCYPCLRPLISLCEFDLRNIKLRLRFPHFVAHVAQLGPASTWVGRNRGRFCGFEASAHAFESPIGNAAASMVP